MVLGRAHRRRACGDLRQAGFHDVAAYRLVTLIDAVEDGQGVHDVAAQGRLLARPVEAASPVPQLPQMRAVGRRGDMVDASVADRAGALVVVDEQCRGQHQAGHAVLEAGGRLYGDHPAGVVPDQVEPAEAERLDQISRRVREPLHSVRPGGLRGRPVAQSVHGDRSTRRPAALI
ncbi:hypothetical protein GCM10010524_27990 [Streptomyces mexicanus]